MQGDRRMTSGHLVENGAMTLAVVKRAVGFNHLVTIVLMITVQ